MNKKLLAMAVSAALVAPAAVMAADVTLYGQAQVEVASYSEDTAGSGTDGVRTQDKSRGRLGVKTTEDLGNGMKAFAQFEWKVDTTDGGRDAGNRVSQVGVKGGFGTVALGNLKAPYKYAGGVKYDPFVATSLQARGNAGMTSGSFGQNSFINDSVMYTSPKGPITFGLLYAPSEDDGAWSMAVKYKQGGIEAFVSANDQGDRPSGGVAGNQADASAVKVGGQYKMGMHKVSFQFEQTDATDSTGAIETDADVWFLGYQAKMGMNTFVAQLGNTDVTVKTSGVSVSGEAAYAALGVIHKMSKTTRVFAGWRDTENVESVVTIGLRKDFKS